MYGIETSVSRVRVCLQSLKEELQQAKQTSRALERRAEKLEVALELRTFEREIKHIASGEAHIVDSPTRCALSSSLSLFVAFFLFEAVLDTVTVSFSV